MAYTGEDYENQELQGKRHQLHDAREEDVYGRLLGEPTDEVVLLAHKGVNLFETDLPDHVKRLGITHL